MTTKRLALALTVLLAPFANAEINLDGPETGGDGGGSDPVPPSAPPPAWSKTYTKSELFGTSDWGAGYKLVGGVSATPAHDLVRDTLGANANLETYAKINGAYQRLFAARATGTTEAQRRTDLSFNAYVGPSTIYTRSFASTTSTQTFANVPVMSWTVPFFSKQATVSVVGIPVTFTVKANGQLTGNLVGKISNAGIEASTSPVGKASLYASAAIGGEWCIPYIGCVGASAGVYSDVTLIEASVPASVAVRWSLSYYGGVLLDYLAKASFNLKSLTGELGVYARACLIDCTEGNIRLIELPGFVATFTLANMQGSHCLAGTCSLPMLGFK